MQPFNYNALRGLIREKGFTQETLADAAHLSTSQLSAKLNGRFAFRQSDIASICDVLDIQPGEIGHYFFSA